MVTTLALPGQSRRPSAAEVLPGQENSPHRSKAGKAAQERSIRQRSGAEGRETQIAEVTRTPRTEPVQWGSLLLCRKRFSKANRNQPTVSHFCPFIFISQQLEDVFVTPERNHCLSAPALAKRPV